MTDCGFCPYDYEQDCDGCLIPEFTDDKYRDTCDVCHKFIMIHYDARDRFNLIVCRNCSYETPEEYELESPIGTYEGVYVEGEDSWWR